MEGFLQDLKYAARLLIKRPGFTAVAVLSLTLGIGPNTTIFTLAKAVFLQTVPVKEPNRVVVVFGSRNGGKLQFVPNSYLNSVDLREKNDVFSGLSIVIPAGVRLVVDGKDNNIFCEMVNGDFFDIVGVQPALGRGFRPDEDGAPGAHAVAVISTALWNRQFGADKGIVGKTIRLNAQDYTVIGVTGPKFHDLGSFGSPDVFVPVAMHDQVLTGIVKGWVNQRGAGMAFLVGRLKPGVTFQQAEASMHNLGNNLEREYPNQNRGRNVMLMRINDTVIPPQQQSDFFRAGTMMGTIVGLILLIACANVANLLMARGTYRQREIAVRLSMGASRARLVRQLLTESLLLGLVAGTFGIACAFGVRRLISALLPPNVLPASVDLGVDGRVLVFTLALSVVATFLFGLFPALQASRADGLSALRDRTGAPTGSTRWYGLRGVLVMIQVALSLVALIGAGLFIHSLRNAQQIDPGFDVRHTLTVGINLGAERYPQAKAEQFFEEAASRAKALPMVADAGFSDVPPLSGANFQRTTFTNADTSDPLKGKITSIMTVFPGFFSSSGMTLLKGRDFTPQDGPRSAMVCVVNTAAAEQFWPGEDAVGKHLHFLLQTWDVNVIGVVNTVKLQTLGEPPAPLVYFAFKQQFAPAMVMWVRTKGDPANALSTVRTTVQSMDEAVPLRAVFTGDQLMEQSLSAPRLGAELLGGFGFLALALAALGTYGVMSYSVTQRRQEIGVRMALGAQRTDVLRLILSGGMATVCAGIVAGLLLSMVLARGIHGLLYGIGIFDSASFLGTATILIATALIACWIPAYRAARVHPVVALRYE
jgi:predicted permease